jgi:hypothetical protein
LDFEPSKTSSCEWKPWSLESIKNDRNKRNVVWLKVKIPQIDLKDPVIFFDSIDLNYELYIENKLYHQYGKFDKNFNIIFDGWPLHIIPITKEFSNKILYLKVYSIYEYLEKTMDHRTSRFVFLYIKRFIFGSYYLFNFLFFQSVGFWNLYCEPKIHL